MKLKIIKSSNNSTTIWECYCLRWLKTRLHNEKLYNRLEDFLLVGWYELSSKTEGEIQSEEESEKEMTIWYLFLNKFICWFSKSKIPNTTNFSAFQIFLNQLLRILHWIKTSNAQISNTHSWHLKSLFIFLMILF